MHKKQEKRGQKAGFPSWWDAGEIGLNYPTMYNFLKSQKRKSEGAKGKGRGPNLRGMDSGKYGPLSPPPNYFLKRRGITLQLEYQNTIFCSFSKLYSPQINLPEAQSSSR